MDGLRRSPPRSIHLGIRAGGALMEAACLKKIPVGCIAILCGNHPVVDYVCHSESGELFFIQASVSRYSRHKSSYCDLVAAKNGAKSIMQEWEDRAWGITPKKKRSPSYYVYITTSDQGSVKDKENPQVLYVGPEQLSGILKPETVRILLKKKVAVPNQVSLPPQDGSDKEDGRDQ